MSEANQPPDLGETPTEPGAGPTGSPPRKEERRPVTHTPTASGIGGGFVPRSGILVLTILLVVLSVVILYSLWAFWPTALSETSKKSSAVPRLRVHYLGIAQFGVPKETLFFVIVALSGALGGLIHTIRSLTVYVGSRRLKWSWVPFNVCLPVVGALGGTVFYLVFRAGLFSPSTSVEQASPFGFAAVAVLVGLFSEQAMEKLREVAENLFSKTPATPDHFT